MASSSSSDQSFPLSSSDPSSSSNSKYSDEITRQHLTGYIRSTSGGSGFRAVGRRFPDGGVQLSRRWGAGFLGGGAQVSRRWTAGFQAVECRFPGGGALGFPGGGVQVFGRWGAGFRAVGCRFSGGGAQVYRGADFPVPSDHCATYWLNNVEIYLRHVPEFSSLSSVSPDNSLSSLSDSTASEPLGAYSLSSSSSSACSSSCTENENDVRTYYVFNPRSWCLDATTRAPLFASRSNGAVFCSNFVWFALYFCSKTIFAYFVCVI